MGRIVFPCVLGVFGCLAIAQYQRSSPLKSDSKLDQELVVAVQLGDAAKVTSLLKRGANPNDTHALFLLGGNSVQQLGVAKALIEGGANAKEVRPGSMSTVDYALSKSAIDPSLVRLFLEKGVNPNRYDYRGMTPLHSAVRLHQIEVVKDLIAYRANVNAKTKTTSSVTTDATAQAYEPAFIEAGKTPLMLLADKWDATLATILIDAGADIKAKDVNGWTALHYAAKAQDSVGIEDIVKLGASVNASSRQGYTPLHVAARGASQASIGSLLGQKADPKLRNKSGQTPMELLRSDTLRKVRGFQAKPSTSSNGQVEQLLDKVNPLLKALDLTAVPISTPEPLRGPNGIRYAALEMNGVKVDRSVELKNGKAILTLHFQNSKELSGQNKEVGLTLDGALMGFKDSTSSFPIEVNLRPGQKKQLKLEFPAEAGESGVLTLWYHDTDYPPVYGAGIVGEELVYTPIFKLNDQKEVQVHFAVGQGQSVLLIDDVQVNGKSIESLKGKEFTLTPSEKLVLPDLTTNPTKSKCTIIYRYRLAENTVWHKGVREF